MLIPRSFPNNKGGGSVTGLTIGTGDGRYQKDQRVYVATDPVWGYVSGSDLTTAFTNILAAIPSSGPYQGGNIIVPAGNWTFSSRVTLKSGVRVTGAGRQASRITASTNGHFTWTADLTNVIVEHLNLVSGAGHIFAPSGGAADWGIFTTKVQNCNLTMVDVNSSIMYHVSGRDYDNVDFEHCYFTRPTASTVPGIYIVNSGGAANANRFRDCWAHSNNCTSSPMFWLESTAVSNYAYDNVFKNITGEQNAGGIIRALGVHNLVVENVMDYDTTATYTGSVIHIGKSVAGGIRSLSPTVSNSGRRDNTTLPGGVYDLNLVPGEVLRGTVIAPNHSSSQYKINFGTADNITILNAPAAAWSGQPTNVKNYFGAQAQFGSGLYLGAAQQTSGTGTPEGVVTGNVGDQFIRTDGGRFSSFYVKETGTGNTGWIAPNVPNPRLGEPLPIGEATFDRRTTTGGNTIVAGQIWFTYFTASVTETINSVVTYTAGAAQVAATLCRVGIYSVASNGDLTLVASTANDTSLWLAANTKYPKALSGAFSKVAGQTYAIAQIVVGSSTPPVMVSGNAGTTGAFDTVLFQEPRIASTQTGQTDLTSSITNASLGASRRVTYFELLR